MHCLHNSIKTDNILHLIFSHQDAANVFGLKEWGCESSSELPEQCNSFFDGRVGHKQGAD